MLLENRDQTTLLLKGIRAFYHCIEKDHEDFHRQSMIEVNTIDTPLIEILCKVGEECILTINRYIVHQQFIAINADSQGGPFVKKVCQGFIGLANTLTGSGDGPKKVLSPVFPIRQDARRRRLYWAEIKDGWLLTFLLA
jgi:hypothetical protein